jgi:hypothetical protein
MDAAGYATAFPPELLTAAILEGSCDAERVAGFLEAVGLGASPDHPRQLPPVFLLELAAALRLYFWEAAGIQIHRSVGLPDARTAIIAAFQKGAALIHGEATGSPDLWRQVNQLLVNRFAWLGRLFVTADVELGELDEDTALEALAEFVWAHRHAHVRQGNETPGATP